MTTEEAIKFIDDRHFDSKCDAYRMAIAALEKQIPGKIKQDIVNGKMARWCPNGCEITHITQYSSINYCPKCGQKLDLD